jgi:Rieske Fe-S protein
MSELRERENTDALSGSCAEWVVEERRSFLGVLSGLIAAGISTLLGVTAGRYVVLPALAAAESEQWTEAGTLQELPEGKPVRRSVIVTQTSGWGQFSAQRPVWVIRQGDNVQVFSAVCPHLGCTVNEAAQGFVCPCHNSAWDGAGARLSGPTPRGLDALEHRLEAGALKIKYQDFKQGIAAKEVAG